MRKIHYKESLSLAKNLPCHKSSSINFFVIPFIIHFLCKFHSGATNASFDDTKATEKPSTTAKYTMPAYTVGGPSNDPYVEDIF